MKKEMQIKKNNKGITIVALTVTIIVLIILAGISINLTLGENGIITKAKLAKESYLNAQEAEEQDLASLYNELFLSSTDRQDIYPSDILQDLEELKELLERQMEKTEKLEEQTGVLGQETEDLKQLLQQQITDSENEMQDKIEALNAKTDVKTFTTKNTHCSNFTIYKIGKLCICNFIVPVTKTFKHQEVIGMIPEECRPKDTAIANFTSYETLIGHLIFAPEGEIFPEITYDIPASYWIYGSTSWISAK